MVHCGQREGCVIRPRHIVQVRHIQLECACVRVCVCEELLVFNYDHYNFTAISTNLATLYTHLLGD